MIHSAKGVCKRSETRRGDSAVIERKGGVSDTEGKEECQEFDDDAFMKERGTCQMCMGAFRDSRSQMEKSGVVVRETKPGGR